MDLSELKKELIGALYLYPRADFIHRKFGPVETLEGTDNKTWIAYFSGGDFTMIVEKKTDTIQDIKQGKKPKRKRRRLWKT